MTPHMIGGTLSYRYRRFALSTSGKWTDMTPMNTAAIPTLRKGRTMIDLSSNYPFTGHYSMFLQVRNLFNVPEYRHQIDPSYATQNRSVGNFYTLGVKGFLATAALITHSTRGATDHFNSPSVKFNTPMW